MAKKVTIHFECIECGHSTQRWLGRCPGCNAWNSFKEVKEAPALHPAVAMGLPNKGPGMTSGTSDGQSRGRVQSLAMVEIQDGIRFTSGSGEFDRVLGGGFMTASSILLGGEPGIGKSTLLSQAAAAVGANGSSILYANGEESSSQVRLRWERLNLTFQGVHVLDSCRVDLIRETMASIKPSLVIIDSVQTLYDPSFDSPPGSIQQAKFGVFSLSELCRSVGATLCLVAHVTKEGVIAGPKVLEHMVDTVLYFEEAEGGIRFLRAQKNRFGATDELGLFRMEDNGLLELQDSSVLFRQERDGDIPPGIVLGPVWEGSRAFMVEIQALAVPGKSGFQRLFSEKIDQRRVSRIAAILEKHGGLKLSDQDLYVHVAGGLKIQDPALDLALAIALFSARTGLAVPGTMAVFGELTLAGEVRIAGKAKKRALAALELSLTRVIGPRSAEGDLPPSYQSVKTVRDALSLIFGKAKVEGKGD